MRLSAASLQSARYLLRAPMASWPVRQLRLTIRSWEPPTYGWPGQLGPLPGLVRQRVSLPRTGRGKATVELTLADPTQLRQLLQSALAALSPSVGRLDAIVNPIGHVGRHGERRRHVRLHVHTGPAGPQWCLAAERPGTPDVPWASSWSLQRRQLSTLHELDVVHCSGPGVPAHLVAQLVVQIAMTGAIVSWPDLPPEVGRLVGGETAELIRTPLPDDKDEALLWDARSVALRRAALREHGAGFGKQPRDWPAVSVLLATRRPESVPRILAQLDAQTYPDLELVLAVHGGGLPNPLPSVRFPVRCSEVPASAPLGAVLTAATHQASGALLTKVDDDDTYGPHHVWDLVLAQRYSQAMVVGKPDEFVFLEELDTTLRRRGFRHEEYSHWVAGGTLLISRADLEAIGGWKPVPSSVDRALLDAAIAAGGLVYRTHGFGYLYHRHNRGHTWNPGLDFYLTRADAQWPGALDHPEFGGGPRPTSV